MINHTSLTNPSNHTYQTPCSAILVASLPIFLALILGGCDFLQYSAKPIDPVANTVKFEAKDPASEQFNEYLIVMVIQLTSYL